MSLHEAALVGGAAPVKETEAAVCDNHASIPFLLDNTISMS